MDRPSVVYCAIIIGLRPDPEVNYDWLQMDGSELSRGCILTGWKYDWQAFLWTQVSEEFSPNLHQVVRLRPDSTNCKPRTTHLEVSSPEGLVVTNKLLLRPLLRTLHTLNLKNKDQKSKKKQKNIFWYHCITLPALIVKMRSGTEIKAEAVIWKDASSNNADAVACQVSD